MSPKKPETCQTCGQQIGSAHLSPRNCSECDDYWTWWTGLTDAERQQEHRETYSYLLKHGAADYTTVERLWQV